MLFLLFCFFFFFFFNDTATTEIYTLSLHDALPIYLGAIAPGYQADILVLDDLVSFRPRQVLKRGEPPRFTKLEVPEWVRQTVYLAPVDADSFRIASGPKRIRVIRVIPGQLLTGTEIAEPAVRDGGIIADPARDLVKIPVL